MSFFKNLEKLPNYRTFLPLGFDGTRGGGGGLFRAGEAFGNIQRKTRAKHQVQINLTHFLMLTQSSLRLEENMTTLFFNVEGTPFWQHPVHFPVPSR